MPGLNEAGHRHRPGLLPRLVLWATMLGSLGGALAAQPAQAAEGDLELWTMQEWYSPLGTGPKTQAPEGPTRRLFEASRLEDLRVGTVQRLASRTQGFQHAVLRVGPQWSWGPQWALGAQLFSSVEQSAPGRWLQEQRLELEARPQQSWGPWGLSGRGRFEGRALPTGFRTRWRLAGSLAYSLPPLGPTQGWKPFFSAEAFWEPQAGGWNQARFLSGTSLPWGPGQRLGVAHLLRPRLVGPEWLWDQGLFLTWTWKGQP